MCGQLMQVHGDKQLTLRMGRLQGGASYATQQGALWELTAKLDEVGHPVTWAMFSTSLKHTTSANVLLLHSSSIYVCDQQAHPQSMNGYNGKGQKNTIVHPSPGLHKRSTA